MFAIWSIFFTNLTIRGDKVCSAPIDVNIMQMYGGEVS